MTLTLFINARVSIAQNDKSINMDYEIGDVVCHKTNGNEMVVESVCPKTGNGCFEGDVFCAYYDKSENKLHAKYFDPNTLDFYKHDDENIVPELGMKVMLKSDSAICVIDEIDGDEISCTYNNGRFDQHSYKIWKKA